MTAVPKVLSQGVIPSAGVEETTSPGLRTEGFIGVDCHASLRTNASIISVSAIRRFVYGVVPIL